VDNPADDGVDFDVDGLCDAGDPDDDNDGVLDGVDTDPQDASVCEDVDGDTCDDCAVGVDGTGALPDNDPANDGPDADLDGICNAGDGDDDNDGVADGSDCAPFVNSVNAPAGDLGDTLRLGPTNDRIWWLKTPNANVYNVYRGSLPAGVWLDYNHTCLATERTSLEAPDAADPATGEVYYYLVSGTNTCGGDGGLGADSGDLPRPNDTPCVPQGNDSEGDGVLDIDDNCPLALNPLQEDEDLDQRGSACDNCPAAANPDQEDADLDGPGDACDTCTDLDDDGFGDPGFPANTCQVDNCPSVPNPSQLDSDADSRGDACDPCNLDPDDDIDNDTRCADVDNCPNDYNWDQVDEDGDGIGDACDPCRTNPDTQCVACPDPQTTDPDADGFCQSGSVVVVEGSGMDYLANSSDPGIGLDWIEEGFTPDANWQPGVFGVGFETQTALPNASNLITTPVSPVRSDRCIGRRPRAGRCRPR
jgi:hypothetical protein